MYFYSAYVDSGDDEINDGIRDLSNASDTRPEMRVTDATNQTKFVPIQVMVGGWTKATILLQDVGNLGTSQWTKKGAYFDAGWL